MSEEIKKNLKEELTNLNEWKRWDDMRASQGKPGYAGGKGAAADNMRADHPNKEKATSYAWKDNKVKYSSAAAAVAAGLGALAIAKKMRATKAAAKKKKA